MPGPQVWLWPRCPRLVCAPTRDARRRRFSPGGRRHVTRSGNHQSALQRRVLTKTGGFCAFLGGDLLQILTSQQCPLRQALPEHKSLMWQIVH